MFSDNSGMIWLYGENEKTETGEYHSDGSYSFDVNGTYDSCVVPKYYYKGYEATVADPAGSQELLSVSKDPDTGLVRLELNGKKRNDLCLVRKNHNADSIEMDISA